MTLAQQKIHRHLDPGEKLVWAERPVQRPILAGRGPQFLLTLFIVIVFFIGIPYLFVSPKLGDLRLAPFLYIMLAVFGALGAYIVFGKLVTLYAQRHLTFYGVSERRLIVVTRTVTGGNVKSMDIDLIRSSTKTVQADGSGTLKFGTTPSTFLLYADAGSPTGESIFGQYVITFFDVPEAAKVYELVEIMRKDKMVAGEPTAE